MIQRAARHPDPLPELWAGIECSVVRVGDAYHDQLERSGHAARPEDLDRIAGLGVRALRQPVLWERTAPDGPERADWAWPDERLGRLRALGVRPIVGLVHHGSGPRHTNLLDPAFAPGLAAYAGAVARRYPWVEDYTPVNEPLTTARFSGLYGHWYPHGRDPLSFARAVLNQCRAVALAMRAIRRVNPAARLVQTEDLGRTTSTPALAYQAEHENERRWLSLDLLCGRLDRDRPMWHFLRWLGVPKAELDWFCDNPCPPDVIGINHYLTGERFLDDRLEHYPPELHGGNGRHAYADVEAVRVLAAGPAGPAALVREAWRRYGRPLAITEAHLGCTREEQLRWLLEIWDAARRLRRGGVDVRAVTAWAVLGSYDWNRLVTRCDGHYEPGAFDLRAPQPRPTALAALVRDLASGRTPDHPVLHAPGWWRRPERLLYPPPDGPAPRSPGRTRRLRPLAIVGATGTLGRAFARLCHMRGLPVRLLARAELDVTDGAAVAAALGGLRPWAVINATGTARVDDAERDPDRCRRVHADGPAALAAACARRRIALVVFSSDLVFDGRQGTPYVEGDAVGPRNAYGRCKAEMEARVREILPSALIVRTAACFGPWDGRNAVAAALRTLAAGRRLVAAADEIASPTYVPDLAQATLDLLIDGE
ncbi:MAG TPA: sugar nucleotide-binding protein, partial [Isosphaeraceae bacterium]